MFADVSILAQRLQSNSYDLPPAADSRIYDSVQVNPTKPFAEILRDIRMKAYDETTGTEDTYAASSPSEENTAQNVGSIPTADMLISDACAFAG
jgi:hypothetical protein